jgi:hypothetical protein
MLQAHQEPMKKTSEIEWKGNKYRQIKTRKKLWCKTVPC